MMSTELIIERFPTLAKVIGDAWLQRTQEYEDFLDLNSLWFEQLENDLGILESRVGLPKLIRFFRSSLQSLEFGKVWDTIYEIHGSVLLAAVSTDIDLHVPTGNGKNNNFDIRTTIQGVVINADSKTRIDDPFPGRRGLRAIETIDPHDAADLGIEIRGVAADVSCKSTPESTVIRERLLECVEAQLPPSGCNLIIFGHKVGDPRDLVRALAGSEFLWCYQDPEIPSEMSRFPLGAFCSGEAGEKFRHLSGIISVQLKECEGMLRRKYRLHINVSALTVVPSEVCEAIETVMSEWDNSAGFEVFFGIQE